MNMNSQPGRTVLTVSSAVAMLLAAAAAGAQESTPANLGQVIVTAQKRVRGARGSADVDLGGLRRGAGAQPGRQFPGHWCPWSRASASTRTRAASRASRCAASIPAASHPRSASTSTTCRSARAAACANGAILSGDFDTFDLARVEVLRGPQGTLYGASSLGGVLKYVANEPSTAGFEVARPGDDGGREGRRHRLRAGRRAQRADVRDGRHPRQRLLPFRRGVHRLDRQQPGRLPAESGSQYRRRHPRRGQAQRTRHLRRPPVGAVPGPRTASRST